MTAEILLGMSQCLDLSPSSTSKSQLPAKTQPGRPQVMRAHVVGSQSPLWETWIEFQLLVLVWHLGRGCGWRLAGGRSLSLPFNLNHSMIMKLTYEHGSILCRVGEE